MKVRGKVNFADTMARELLLGTNDETIRHDKPWEMAYDALYKRADFIDRIPLNGDEETGKKITVLIASHKNNKEEIDIFFEFNSNDIAETYLCDESINEVEYAICYVFKKEVMKMLADYKQNVGEFIIKNICMIDQNYDATFAEAPAKTFDRVYWEYNGNHLFSVHVSMTGFFGIYELIQEYNAPTASRIITAANEHDVPEFENGDVPIYNGILKIALKMIASYIAVADRMHSIDTHLSEENVSK